MSVFDKFLEGFEDIAQRARVEEVLNWVAKKYPRLEPRIAWNQPMFTDHGTYIIGFSVARQHMAVAPERATIEKFENEIKEAGYSCTKMLFRIRWDQPVDYSLLEKIIEFNIADKADYKLFWRKPN